MLYKKKDWYAKYLSKQYRKAHEGWKKRFIVFPVKVGETFDNKCIYAYLCFAERRYIYKAVFWHNDRYYSDYGIYEYRLIATQ